MDLSARDRLPISGSALVLLLMLTALAPFPLVIQARSPLSDCLTNPFATDCRGISAKRSQPYGSDTAKQETNRWQYPINRMSQQTTQGSLGELMLRPEIRGMGQVIGSRRLPITGRFYFYETPASSSQVAAQADDFQHPDLPNHEEH